MPKGMITKESILEVSRSLLREQGWTAITIRTVAAACGVSVGSIYNYFDSKSELVMATVASIWQYLFHTDEDKWKSLCFSDYIVWLFQNIEQRSRTYPGFFAAHPLHFQSEDKEKGRQLMAASQRHIRKQLYDILIQDTAVRPKAFTSQFTAEKFIDLIFSFLLAALLQENYDTSAIIEVIRRILY
ncbi:TetR/AcrR family transcriptional regulator [Megasphaera cerevisiae]|uniref:TetR/AcrR family transcriptional regulator n=1 Tax=Megasphaera cerevisiae TaxID=39029 RepID=UPI000944420C|nr:TetR/AcrR family transcriptional regulator [Megasphaera cerevisiae]OKY54393.1 TetR family transcriptional regulator [Megasphaera cerevisiae]